MVRFPLGLYIAAYAPSRGVKYEVGRSPVPCPERLRKSKPTLGLLPTPLAASLDDLDFFCGTGVSPVLGRGI